MAVATTRLACFAIIDIANGGERRLRALTEVVPTVRIPWPEWRVDDPSGDTLRDVDVPSDLGR